MARLVNGILALLSLAIVAGYEFNQDLGRYGEQANYETITEVVDELSGKDVYAVAEDMVDTVYDPDVLLDTRNSFDEQEPDALVDRKGYRYIHIPPPPAPRPPLPTARPPSTTEPTVTVLPHPPYPTSPPIIPQPPVEPCETDDDHPHAHIGSIPGRPGIDFPLYTEIPLTDFSCAGRHVPGFYADVETRCQVFHVCYPHRRESFLCPVGTVFNQPILSCDYWYSANCSDSENYFAEEIIFHEPEMQEEAVPEIYEEPMEHVIPTIVEDFHEEIVEPEKPLPPPVVKPVKVFYSKLAPHVPKPVHHEALTEEPQQPSPPVLPPVFPDIVAKQSGFEQIMALVAQFLPIKAKIVTKLSIPAAVPVKATSKVMLAAAPKMMAMKHVVPAPYRIPVYRPQVVPVVKPVPVAALVKAALAPTVKAAVAGRKILIGKPKFAAPLVKPLAFTKIVKVKKIKAASVPAISLFTKRYLTTSALRMLEGQQRLQSAKPVDRY